jgi:hypothetical protein
MKKYIIEVDERVMEVMKAMKKEIGVGSISGVVAHLVMEAPSLWEKLKEKERELEQYRQKLVEIALKS